MILVEPAVWESIVKDLWTTGLAVRSGGVIAGGVAYLMVRVFSKVASIIVFAVLLVVCGMVACRISPAELLEQYRNRPRYEEEPEPVRPVRTPEPAIRHAAEQPSRKTSRMASSRAA